MVDVNVFMYIFQVLSYLSSSQSSWTLSNCNVRLEDQTQVQQRRQKELMSEWKSNASRYAKNLKALEESWKKIGPFPVELEGSESENAPLVQGDDIVLWKQHIYEGGQQIQSAIDKLRFIQKDRKQKKLSPAKALKRSMKKKRTSRKVQLDVILKYLDSFMEFLNNQFAHAELTEQFVTLGNHRVAGGELSEENATKLREELVSLNTRWNRLNEQTLHLTDKSDHFVQDVHMEYKKHALWCTKCDNMEQWLSESEKLVRQQSTIADNKDGLKEQFDDNEEFRKEVREYNQTSAEVLLNGVQIVERNRLDNVDIEATDKITEGLRQRWHAIETHLNERHNMIIARLRENSADWSKQDVSPWKDTTEELQSALTAAQYKLESIDDHLTDSADEDTLELCASDIKEVEDRLRKHTNGELASLSTSSAAWINQKKLDRRDEQKLLDTINELHSKLSQLDEGVVTRKNRVKVLTGQRTSRNVEICEHIINDLDNQSLDNFSSAGSNINEVQKQLHEIQKFECRIVEEEAKFGDLKVRFDESARNGMIDDNTTSRLNYRIRDLEWRWKELRRENQTNKQRLVAALLLFSRELMGDIYSWLDDAETRVDAVQVREGDRRALEASYVKHKELNEEMNAYEPSIRTAVKLGKKVVAEQLLDPETGPGYEEEMQLLEKRMDNLREISNENETRLTEALVRCPAAAGDDVVDEAVVAADVQAEVEASPYMENENLPYDQPLSDEGFGDAESTSGTDRINEVNENEPNAKLEQFNLHMRNMYKWIDETDRMVKGFHVGMDSGEASKLQEQIETRCDEVDKKQTQVNYICKLGKQLEVDLKDPDTTEEIEEELTILNKRWSDSQDALDCVTDRGVHRKRAPRDSGCCLMVALRKKMSTLCAYN